MVITNLLNIAITVLGIAGILGVAITVFFKAGKAEASKEQTEAISAMQSQIASIKDKQSELERDNTRLRQIIETIQTALRTKGIHVTIDGDFVSISSTGGHTTTHRKTQPRKKPLEDEHV